MKIDIIRRDSLKLSGVLSLSERLELYDLKNDPGELNNLSSSKREKTAELLHELKQKLAQVDEPYA